MQERSLLRCSGGAAAAAAAALARARVRRGARAARRGAARCLRNAAAAAGPARLAFGGASGLVGCSVVVAAASSGGGGGGAQPQPQPQAKAARGALDFGSPLRRCTDALLVANAAAFALQWLSRDALTLWGAKVNSLIAAGQVWRLLTSSLLHTSLFHLLVRGGDCAVWHGSGAFCNVQCEGQVAVAQKQVSRTDHNPINLCQQTKHAPSSSSTLHTPINQINSHALHTIGPHLEAVSGAPRFAAVYAAGALAGTTASFLLTPAPSVGASAALFGAGAALAVFYHRHRAALGERSDHVLRQLGLTLAINLAYSLANRRVDNWGHLGGMAGGALAAWALGPRLVPAAEASARGGSRATGGGGGGGGGGSAAAAMGRLVDDPPLPWFAGQGVAAVMASRSSSGGRAKGGGSGGGSSSLKKRRERREQQQQQQQHD